MEMVPAYFGCLVQVLYISGEHSSSHCVLALTEIISVQTMSYTIARGRSSWLEGIELICYSCSYSISSNVADALTRPVCHHCGGILVLPRSMTVTHRVSSLKLSSSSVRPLKYPGCLLCDLVIIPSSMH
jgi:hypothetical protein